MGVTTQMAIRYVISFTNKFNFKHKDDKPASYDAVQAKNDKLEHDLSNIGRLY